MNSKQLETDLMANVEKLQQDLLEDVKDEIKHIVDPSQSGVIFEKHFDGLMISLFVFIGLFMLTAMAGIATYVRV